MWTKRAVKIHYWLVSNCMKRPITSLWIIGGKPARTKKRQQHVLKKRVKNSVLWHGHIATLMKYHLLSNLFTLCLSFLSIQILQQKQKT